MQENRKLLQIIWHYFFEICYKLHHSMEEEDDPLPGGPVDQDLAEYTQSF